MFLYFLFVCLFCISCTICGIALQQVGEIKHIHTYTLIHWILTHEAQIFGRFTLQPAVSRYKIVEHRKCTKWPQINFENCQKYHVCTEYLPPRPKFLALRAPVSLFEIQDCRRSEMYQITLNTRQKCEVIVVLGLLICLWTWNLRENPKISGTQSFKIQNNTLWGPSRRKLKRSLE